MNFDLSNCFMKIWGFIGIPLPNLEVHLGVCGLIPSHSFALPRVIVTPKLHSQPAPFHALALGTNLRLGS